MARLRWIVCRDDFVILEKMNALHYLRAGFRLLAMIIRGIGPHAVVATAAMIAAILSCSPGRAQLPATVKRILFVGDSITYSGGYIASLEAAWIVQHPEQPIEFLNLGLPSETVSGLSEPGHAGGAFPRPDLHERLQRVLDQTKPDWVIACYGMNDGIYYPLGEERFQAFRSGIERLHDAVVKHGSQIIHLTPAYFDALPIRDRLLPAGREEYRQPYEGYDEVLETYARWLLEQRQRGWVVFDVHDAMKQTVLTARKSNPTFTFASDGVHPNAAGQVAIAGPLAKAWGLYLKEDGTPDHAEGKRVLELVTQRQEILKHAWLTKTVHLRPGIPAGLPIDEAQGQAAQIAAQLKSIVQGLR
jgi:lysophospholipase L1-like esterase